jgi:hypothetical protein
VYAPDSVGPSAFGITDMELGAKVAWIKESKYFPQIGSFTMLELPTGNSAKGLGVGHVWYKLPLWAYKKIGSWGLDGGAGYTIVPQTDYSNYAYGGFLVEKNVNERLDLSIEVFSHAHTGFGAAQNQGSTLIDAGGYYHFKSPGLQVAVRLRPLGCRPDRELWVSRRLQDLGQRQRRRYNEPTECDGICTAALTPEWAV